MAKVRLLSLTLALAACVLLSSCGGGSQAVPPPPPQPTFTVLYSFTGGDDGGGPSTARMVQDAQGNLYGTTQTGGDLSCNDSLHYGCGTVWKLDTAGNLTPLHIFSGAAFDIGGSSGLAFNGNGNLYGTAGDGLGNGLVFEVDLNGTYTVIYDFAGGSDGTLPQGYLFRDAMGDIYGTTLQGGGSIVQCPYEQSCGTVFELDPTAQHKVLYSFLDSSGGANPNSLIGDSAGNLYGTTWLGGQGCPQLAGCGTIFKLDTSGTKTVLHYFTGGNDGSTPNGSLVLDSAGNLYGTAQAGGDLTCPSTGGAGCGVVFELDASGVLTVLHAFHGFDGLIPVSVTLAASGDLYGTTQSGIDTTNLCGTVFKLDTRGNLTNLYNFVSTGEEGCFPDGQLVQDAAGNLYGATGGGGPPADPNICPQDGCGTIFEIKF